MEIIIAMAIATMATSHSLKNTIVDGWYGLKGRPSPRMVRSAKRRDARARRQRGAFGTYVSELWRDSWADAHDKRIRRRHERLSREPWPRGAFRSYLRAVSNDWWARWDGAWEQRAERHRSTPTPEFIEASVPGDWKRQDDGSVSARMRCPECGCMGPHTGHFDGDVDFPARLRCVNCGRRALYDMTPDDDPPRPTSTPAEPDPEPEPEPEPAWHVTTPDGGQFIADKDPQLNRDLGHNVRPLHSVPDDEGEAEEDDPDGETFWFTVDPDGHTEPFTPSTTPTTGRNTMTTTPIGEVTGLTTAIHNTGQAAEQAESWGPALEQLSAGITAGGVGGDTTGHLASAQEHMSAAAAALRAAEQELIAQLGVKEAYDATPDAGEKAFVVSE
jgi:hypothetical protein